MLKTSILKTHLKRNVRLQVANLGCLSLHKWMGYTHRHMRLALFYQPYLIHPTLIPYNGIRIQER